MPKSRDLWTGVLFAAFGAFALLVGPADLGSAAEMGAGYFPAVLGALLCVIGFVLAIRGLRTQARNDTLTRVRPRYFVVLLAVVAFALLLERAGLVLSNVVLIFIASLAWRGFGLKQVAALTLVLLALVYCIFVWGIGMPIRLWPQLSAA